MFQRLFNIVEPGKTSRVISFDERLLALSPIGDEQARGFEHRRRADLRARHLPQNFEQDFLDYEDQILKMIQKIDSNDFTQTSGEIDGLKYHVTTDDLSDHEDVVVHGLEIEFPNKDQGKFFLKTCYKDLSSFPYHYQESSAIRKHLPRLYYTAEYSECNFDYDTGAGFMLLEAIPGPVFEDSIDEYRAFMSDENRRNQLADEISELILDLARDGFVICDVDIVDGHNLLFNTREQRFQMIDTDSIFRGQGVNFSSNVAKSFLNFPWSEEGLPEEWCKQILFRMIRNVLDVIPDCNFRFMDEFLNREALEACRQNDFQKFSDVDLEDIQECD